MLQTKYKHPSKQQKTRYRRLTDRFTHLFKREAKVIEPANAWML